MSDPRSSVFYMIGNAHLDPAWMWRWDEGMEAFLATCRSALDRMEENADVVFTCSSAAHYRWVEQVEPELFERIGQRIAEGRWEVVGGWWVQADCNLPGGEGFVRQGVLGQRYFLERFGRAASIGYSPDAFGHNGGLPQILAKSALPFYIFCRPDPAELSLPSPLFRWLSPDGTSVVAYRVPLHYNMYQTSVPKKVADLLAALEGPTDLTTEGRPLSAFGSEWAIFYGIGNHGGGPTKEQIAQIVAIDADPAAPELRFSRLEDFFGAVSDADALPAWRTDLQLNAPGCYSVHTGMKGLNRRSEHLLVRAEIFASLASIVLGFSQSKPVYPSEELRRAWENVCFNHFHDILCGVAIPEALDDATHLYGEALSIADRTTVSSLRRIARSIDTSGHGQTLIVFNPHGFDVDDHITFELWHDIDKDLWSQPVHLRVVDEAGNDVPAQMTRPSGKIGKDRVAATFHARVPAFGWSCWRVIYGEKSPHAESAGLIEASSTALENEHLRVEISSATGAISRLFDKRSGTELLDGEASLPVAIDDPTDTWGHGVTRFDAIVGRFEPESVHLVEHGPTHATVRMVSRWRASRVQQDFTLYTGEAKLHARLRVSWNEPRTMLKLAFPTRLASPFAVAEAAYSSTATACDGTERPTGAWRGLVERTIDGTRGIGIADTLVHGYSVDGSTLSLSLLRSPSYATHDPHVVEPDEDVRYIDIGETELRYTLVPIDDDDFRATLAREAALLNAPPVMMLESAHDGTGINLPRTLRGLSLTPAGVAIGAFKRSEENDGWIVRLFETAGRSTEFSLEIPVLQTRISGLLDPHEVRTVLVREKETIDVDLIERPL